MISSKTSLYASEKFVRNNNNIIGMINKRPKNSANLIYIDRNGCNSDAFDIKRAPTWCKKQQKKSIAYIVKQNSSNLVR